jgi:hypothetical protein
LYPRCPDKDRKMLICPDKRGTLALDPWRLHDED